MPRRDPPIHEPRRTSRPARTRVASVFRNGRNQAVRIPREFEFEAEEVIMRKDGDALVLTPRAGNTLLEVLQELPRVEL